MKRKFTAEKKIFMDKKRLFTGKLNFEPKKKVSGVEWGIVCRRDMDINAGRIK